MERWHECCPPPAIATGRSVHTGQLLFGEESVQYIGDRPVADWSANCARGFAMNGCRCWRSRHSPASLCKKSAVGEVLAADVIQRRDEEESSMADLGSAFETTRVSKSFASLRRRDFRPWKLVETTTGKKCAFGASAEVCVLNLQMAAQETMENVQYCVKVLSVVLQNYWFD